MQGSPGARWKRLVGCGGTLAATQSKLNRAATGGERSPMRPASLTLQRRLCETLSRQRKVVRRWKLLLPHSDLDGGTDVHIRWQRCHECRPAERGVGRQGRKLELRRLCRVRPSSDARVRDVRQRDRVLKPRPRRLQVRVGGSDCEGREDISHLRRQGGTGDEKCPCQLQSSRAGSSPAERLLQRARHGASTRQAQARASGAAQKTPLPRQVQGFPSRHLQQV